MQNAEWGLMSLISQSTRRCQNVAWRGDAIQMHAVANQPIPSFPTPQGDAPQRCIFDGIIPRSRPAAYILSFDLLDDLALHLPLNPQISKRLSIPRILSSNIFHRPHQTTLTMIARPACSVHVSVRRRQVSDAKTLRLSVLMAAYIFYIIVIHVCCRYRKSWEIDPWLHGLGPAHFQTHFSFRQSPISS